MSRLGKEVLDFYPDIEVEIAFMSRIGRLMRRGKIVDIVQKYRTRVGHTEKYWDKAKVVVDGTPRQWLFYRGRWKTV